MRHRLVAEHERRNAERKMRNEHMPSKPDDMQRRLDELGEDIERSRAQAKADGLLPEDDPHKRKPSLADPDPADDPDDDDELPGDATG